jgi:glyoxylase-like metal-dependent hydrolase (beta-lactamase superfamily II)
LPTEDWTEPGVYEVALGVYRIPLPLPNDGLRSVNVYAIVDSEALVLIDSGWAISSAREALERALRSLGYELGDVRDFFVTHVHRDHYSQAVALRRTFGTPISIGHGERPSLIALTHPESKRFTPQIALLYSHGATDVAESIIAGGVDIRDPLTYEMPDTWLENNQEIPLATRTLRAMNTPGHTRGHVVYVDQSAGLMFSGDHVLPHITPSIGFEAAPEKLPLASYLESLRLVRSLPDMKLLPAHGQVAPSVHHRADEILSHHDLRLAQSLKAVQAGSSTASEVARELSWTRRNTPFASMDTQNQMLAVLETASHLDLLAIQGRLRSQEIDGVHRFEALEVD